MRIYRTPEFRDFMEEYGIATQAIRRAVDEIASGLIHASLGGGLYKQRVARAGRGKSGGFRTILIVKFDQHAFFLRGFAKNERENLTPRELKFLKDLAKEMLKYDQKALDHAVRFGVIEEVAEEGSLP